jgi:hypothetical protein
MEEPLLSGEFPLLKLSSCLLWDAAARTAFFPEHAPPMEKIELIEGPRQIRGKEPV